MRHLILASLLGAALGTLVSCATTSTGGTGDPQLDSEIRTLQFHEEQMAHYGRIVDSLGCISPRTPEQEEALRQALAQQDLHAAQWKESQQRAEERAQGSWKRICPLKRTPGMSCND